MMTNRLSAAAAVMLVAALASPADAQARQVARLDRTKMPEAGKAPEIRVPTWTRTTLSNGAELVTSPRPGLPLVAFRMTFIGGSSQFEDPARLGSAALMTDMFSEGTTTRTGDELSNAQQLLGTSIGFSIFRESGAVEFLSLTRQFEPAVELMADMLLNPTFPAEALERRKGQMKVRLTQAKDVPGTIGQNVFNKVLYGENHPYGRVATEQTVDAVTREDIVALHRRFYQPGRAVITVVGDIDPAQVKATLEKALAGWPAGGTRPAFDYPPVSKPADRTIFLVDKPKTPQAVMWMGLPGPSRATPDYYAISVMNAILGGLFQSRLNRNIREEKGYSYGVGSSFGFGRGPGSFRAGSGGIHTTKLDSALVEFMKELRDVQGGRPFTEDEIKQGKESLIQSLPETFGSVMGIAFALAGPNGLYTMGLPENYYHEFAAKVNAVTADDLIRVAKQYIDLDHMAIVIVGDRAVVEEPLRKTGIAPIRHLDIEGKPLPITP